MKTTSLFSYGDGLNLFGPNKVREEKCVDGVASSKFKLGKTSQKVYWKLKEYLIFFLSFIRLDGLDLIFRPLGWFSGSYLNFKNYSSTTKTHIKIRVLTQISIDKFFQDLFLSFKGSDIRREGLCFMSLFLNSETSCFRVSFSNLDRPCIEKDVIDCFLFGVPTLIWSMMVCVNSENQQIRLIIRI